LLGLLRIDGGEFYELVLKSGEIGEAIAKVWGGKDTGGPPVPQPLTLREVAEGFDALADTGVVEEKKSILRRLFGRCAEGREAAYVAKIIFRDMRTGVQEGVLRAAVAEAFGKKLTEVQRCQLLVGDLGRVAVMARHDALCEARFELFHPVQFMLASPEETPEDAAERLAGRAYFCEDKLDGIRAQVHKAGEGGAAVVAIYTRTMERVEGCFPDVVEAVRRLAGEFLLDGEIVPWKQGTVLPFGVLQRRLGRKCPTAEVIRQNPVTFVAFDVLYRDGELTLERPLAERRAALDRLAAGGGLEVTAVTEVVTAAQVAAAFDAARARRNEGIVLKDPGSVYSPGRRGLAWLKLKTHLPTLDCVVTAAEYGHGKRHEVLSDYTFAVWDRDPAEGGAQLVNVGKAYTGLTDEEIAGLTELFLTLSRAQHGSVHVVEPRVVLEIACDQIQKSRRHASGFAMRFPRIKRIRWDKRPEDADRLARVAEVYESGANFARRDPQEISGDEPAAADEPVVRATVRPRGKSKKRRADQPGLFDGLG